MAPLDPRQVAAVLEAYRACGSLRQTAARTGVNPKTVTKYVKQAGLAVGPAHGRGGRADGRTHFRHPRVSDEERERMAAQAAAGISRAQIARAHRRSATTVRRHLRAMGIKPMDPAERARKYPVDERAFATPSDQRDYWLGFLAADGNVFGTKVTLVQKGAEAPHLQRFLSFLQSPRPLYWTPTRHACAAVAWSRPLVCDLYELGITERKSQTLRLDDIVAARPATWLGLLDGDGWVTGQGADGAPHITWTGSRAAMDQCASFWQGIIGRRHAVFRPNQGDLWGFTLGGCSAQHAATVLLAATAYSMPRKRERLEQAAAYRSRRVRRRLSQSPSHPLSSRRDTRPAPAHGGAGVIADLG